MRRSDLEHVIRAAAAIVGERAIVVVGTAHGVGPNAVTLSIT